MLKLLANPDRNTRYGACEALGCVGPRAEVAAPQLHALFNDPDPWLQSLACNAVASLSPEVRKASENDLLALAARKNAADPRGMTQRAIAASLVDPNPDLRQPGILQHSLDGVDRKLLYPAMESWVQNDDALARYGLAPYLSKLTDRDLAVLLPAIIQATGKLAPSDEMFGDGIRIAGLDLLARLHLREGMPLCVSVMEWDRWSGGDRGPACMRCLRQYGVHAKEVLPQLKAMSRRANGKNKDLDKLIADIETATDSPALVSLKDFIAHASAARSSLAQISEYVLVGWMLIVCGSVVMTVAGEPLGTVTPGAWVLDQGWQMQSSALVRSEERRHVVGCRRGDILSPVSSQRTTCPLAVSVQYARAPDPPKLLPTPYPPRVRGLEIFLKWFLAKSPTSATFAFVSQPFGLLSN
ncbi:MAG: hypothetical protein NTW21_04385 [Verrucomicrobia bacterium]|nr:hypothetical protein [Verrucomicrobiota bacterium]